MPAQIIFHYKMYARVIVPTKVAEWLKDKPDTWYILHGDLYYKDESGKMQCINGETPDSNTCDWKRGHEGVEWGEDEDACEICEKKVVAGVVAAEGKEVEACEECMKGAGGE